jgi:hypothetical protein
LEQDPFEIVVADPTLPLLTDTFVTVRVSISASLRNLDKKGNIIFTLKIYIKKYQAVTKNSNLSR